MSGDSQTHAAEAGERSFISYIVIGGVILLVVALGFAVLRNSAPENPENAGEDNGLQSGFAAEKNGDSTVLSDTEMQIPIRNDGPAPIVPANFSTVKVALIATGDGGVPPAGEECNDSVIMVNRVIEPTQAPLRAALTELFSIGEDAGDHYNALASSPLVIGALAVKGGNANIRLAGRLAKNGACGIRRAIKQITQTAMQFPSVSSVSIMLNGEPIGGVLSEPKPDNAVEAATSTE